MSNVRHSYVYCLSVMYEHKEKVLYVCIFDKNSIKTIKKEIVGAPIQPA